jgi:hypothetical protein
VALGELKMAMQANQTNLCGVRPRPKAWTLDFELSPVDSREALPEIQKCRRTVVSMKTR